MVSTDSKVEKVNENRFKYLDFIMPIRVWAYSDGKITFTFCFPILLFYTFLYYIYTVGLKPVL